VNHFGPRVAADLRRRRPKPHATWHLDEVYLKINGRMVYLWRAVDAEGEVLDVLIQSRRNKAAALKLMRKLLKKCAFVHRRSAILSRRSQRTWPCRPPRPRSMAQQPGGELASADAATRTQDAGVQERRIGAKISLRARRHSEYLLRPTPPHLSENAPGLQSGGDDHVARSRCCMMNQADGIFYALWSAM